MAADFRQSYLLNVLRSGAGPFYRSAQKRRRRNGIEEERGHADQPSVPNFMPGKDPISARAETSFPEKVSRNQIAERHMALSPQESEGSAKLFAGSSGTDGTSTPHLARELTDGCSPTVSVESGSHETGGQHSEVSLTRLNNLSAEHVPVSPPATRKLNRAVASAAYEGSQGSAAPVISLPRDIERSKESHFANHAEELAKVDGVPREPQSSLAGRELEIKVVDALRLIEPSIEDLRATVINTAREAALQVAAEVPGDGKGTVGVLNSSVIDIANDHASAESTGTARSSQKDAPNEMGGRRIKETMREDSTPSGRNKAPRLTIKRLDVRIVNQPPASPSKLRFLSRPQISRQNTMETLDRHYFGRFYLSL